MGLPILTQPLTIGSKIHTIMYGSSVSRIIVSKKSHPPTLIDTTFGTIRFNIRVSRMMTTKE